MRLVLTGGAASVRPSERTTTGGRRDSAAPLCSCGVCRGTMYRIRRSLCEYPAVVSAPTGANNYCQSARQIAVRPDRPATMVLAGGGQTGHVESANDLGL